MVKLASARENRTYGPRGARSRAEYINAGLYIFATVLLIGGFCADLSRESRGSGLVLLMIALGLIMAVNVHDLIAHLAGIDYRLRLIEFDMQLGFVEFGVPLVQALGSLLFFLGILFLILQAGKEHGYYKLEKHAMNMLIAGPVLWLLGSINNACQIYERADGHVQILQQSVQIPFLLGSTLFTVGAIINRHDRVGFAYHGFNLLGMTWVWLGLLGSFLFFVGGLANLVKVFKMQQFTGLRLEKLRGGAQERLVQQREAQIPLLIPEDEQRWRLIKRDEEESNVVPTPYKDVLVGPPS